MAEIAPLASEGRSLDRSRGGENFPVAMRVLPRRVRNDLIAIYDVARTIDDLGDEGDPDARTARLEAFTLDLARIWDDLEPREPVLRALAPVVARLKLDKSLFVRLVRANLRDQYITRYRTHADLLGYCELSAHPVGRLVLAVFEVKSAGVGELSDRVCAALQLVEHWQDVGEDYRNGRVYLPQEDLTSFGVTEADLGGDEATPALRRLMIFETDRARELLDTGAPLVGLTKGWARLAIAGYVAGGRAVIDALRRADGDVLSQQVHGRRTDLLRHLVRLLVRPNGGSTG